MRITGLLLSLRLYDSRATFFSLLSAFGWKGRLPVITVLELDWGVSLSLLIIISFSVFSFLQKRGVESLRRRLKRLTKHLGKSSYVKNVKHAEKNKVLPTDQPTDGRRL